MLTVLKVAFSFCVVFGMFEETVSWTIDLPQVRKYFFEKSFEDKVGNKKLTEKVVYDNIHTRSQHFDYEKYREHYADEYEYHGYMERKVHDAVRNGSAYLEGLRRAIENYTQKLESCQRMNFSANVIQLRPNASGQNLSNPSFTLINLTNFNPSNFTFNLPSNFSLNLPMNFTDVVSWSTNFTSFMNMSERFAVFNVSDGFRECMRADRASEHVRRLAELAIWAANELQDKLYADKYDKHGEDHDGTLILKLAWFLDRLAHLTGYDPKPHEFVEFEKTPQPSPAPPMFSVMPGLISNEDMQYLLTCMNSKSSEQAPDRCAYPRRSGDQNSVNSSGSAPSFPSDLNPSGSENHEYTYSEQDYADENMPLPLPPKPTTAVRSKRKRSVREDPLQHLFQYYAKYKAWVGSNQEIKELGDITNTISPNSNMELKREKRFIIKKKLTHLKPVNPLPNLSDIVKHKLGVNYKKDKEQANKIKDFFEKLNVKRPNKTKLKLFRKSKRSLYMNKYRPRVPANPQGDISYYVKNKRGTNYDYNVAQAAMVRAGLEQAFQTGNIELVRRYGSNYNPANREQIVSGYARSILDV